MSPLNVAGRCVRRPPSGQASPEGPPLQSLYATMIKCTAVHSYMVKGEDARRKLKQAFPDLETSNAQNRCKFPSLLASRLRLERLDILDVEPVPQRSFPIPKKTGPARYQIRCSCHSRPAAEVREGDPEAEAGPPEEKPGPRQDFIAIKYFIASNNCRR